MDTSKEYIKVCEKAEKMQIEWKPSIGDYVWRKYTIFGEEIDQKIWPDKIHEIIILHYKSGIDGYFHACTTDGKERIFKHPWQIEKETCIWLPRQDQLQDMMKEGIENTWGLFSRFYKWFSTKFSCITWSFEQLWLAFVIKEKYNKVWDSEKEIWIE